MSASTGRAVGRRIDRMIDVALLLSALVVLVLALVIVWLVVRAGVPALRGEHLAIVQRVTVGTLLVTGLATIIGGGAAVLSAVYLSEFASRRSRSVGTTVLECASALPGVVLGYATLRYLAPTGAVHGATRGLLMVFVLAVMVAPTTALLTLSALQRTHAGVREASAALGLSTWQTTWRAVVPQASRSIGAALLFGFARAAGEAIAVQMLLGTDTATGAARDTQGLFSAPGTLASQVLAVAHGDGSRQGAQLAAAMTLVLCAICVGAAMAASRLQRERAS